MDYQSLKTPRTSRSSPGGAQSASAESKLSSGVDTRQAGSFLPLWLWTEYRPMHCHWPEPADRPPQNLSCHSEPSQAAVR